MNGARLEIEGAAEVDAAFHQLQSDTRSVRVPSQTLADLGLAAAQLRAPVLTGALSASIEERVDDAGGGIATDVEYAPFQEFGTRYVSAQRFMAAGFEAMEGAAQDTYSAWLDDRIAATGGAP